MKEAIIPLLNDVSLLPTTCCYCGNSLVYRAKVVDFHPARDEDWPGEGTVVVRDECIELTANCTGCRHRYHAVLEIAEACPIRPDEPTHCSVCGKPFTAYHPETDDPDFPGEHTICPPAEGPYEPVEFSKIEVDVEDVTSISLRRRPDDPEDRYP